MHPGCSFLRTLKVWLRSKGPLTMPEFTVVEKHLSNYQELRKKMSPELQEAFLNACLSANISEDDWIHCLFAFQAELFTDALDTQMKAIRTALDGALSARQADNKQLASLLTACQTSLRDSTIAVSKQAESLDSTLVRTMGAERDARAKEAGQVQRQLEVLDRDIRDVNKAAEMVRNINYNVFWIATGVALLSGAGLTLAIEHFLFHL